LILILGGKDREKSEKWKMKSKENGKLSWVSRKSSSFIRMNIKKGRSKN
jgi:hypothetical protein